MREDEYALTKELRRLEKYGFIFQAKQIGYSEEGEGVYNIVFAEDDRILEPECSVSDGEMLLHRLDLMGICISTGSACDSKNTQVSHVIKAIGASDDYAKGTIRISLGKDNTAEDAECIVSSLSRVLKVE